jgi:hypothetical protein
VDTSTWSVWHVNVETGEKAPWGGHGGVGLARAEAEAFAARVRDMKQLVPSRTAGAQLWTCRAMKDEEKR